MKRFFDFFASLILLIILSPLFLIVSLIIIIDDGVPVIFSQPRVGMGNELFNIYKFRTMKNGTRNVASGNLEESGDCITKSGRFLRKTSIDEFPQLVNILTGRMSFVGPRPLIPEEEEIRKLREEYNVYSVRPGMTGLAQINGRDNLTDEEKAEFDRQYVEKHTIMLDIEIMFKTVFAVLTGRDVVEGRDKTDKR
ncbi:MAG: sugar transferase [Clostridia bacterium]|nr:sugar transferase [Clostridia bacterium]